MELRQLRYLVRTMELGSISQAALDLGVAQSAVSLQIQHLEGELSTRLLQRTPAGVLPTEAGIAFLSHAKLALRHVEKAVLAAQQSRLFGDVGVGLAPTTSGLLGLPLLQAMERQYPDIRIHLVEGMSGHLGQMLNAREIDIAVLFDNDQARHWNVESLLDERLFIVSNASSGFAALPSTIAAIGGIPLVLPTHQHGLRRAIDSAFMTVNLKPNIVAEVDSLYVLMDMVAAGMAATIQPWSALVRQQGADNRLRWVEIADEAISRRNFLCSLSDDELSPAALATRGVLRQVVRQLVVDGIWKGTANRHLESR